ncbi:hypothetical protein [Rubrimonas cliftonensis]|uniref:Uncharacterized protein n=1 Tax=Rubrimonas cliftonensis TaxID=89524 RepID=A0A1H4FLS7_9RHOB|nr:hypothetical protein [Rubrimonas cliftonensis]SEA98254.1 hypothetical protein SAMN05444370_1252 [Rubrimonas cliftonensis]
MPLPAVLMSPLALRALQVGGAVALGAVLAARRRAAEGPERVDIVSDDALDRVADGADLRLDRANGRADGEARWARTVRLGPNGPGVSVDFAALGRLRVRRVRAGK